MTPRPASPPCALAAARASPQWSSGELTGLSIEPSQRAVPSKCCTLFCFFGSSAESVGSLGRRQVTKRLIQGFFQPIIGTHTIGSPGDHLVLVVEAFHTAQGVRSFCPKPVEQEGAVSPQPLRDLLHRMDPGVHGSCAPGIIMERFSSIICGCPWVWVNLIDPMLKRGNDQSLFFDFVITRKCPHFKSIKH